MASGGDGGVNGGTHVGVFARIRPGQAGERGSSIEADPSRGTVRLVEGGNESVRVNHVFGEEAGQREVYERVLFPAIKHLLDGCHASILAVGPEDSGRSHTLEGARGSKTGLISLFVESVFPLLREKQKETVTSGTGRGRSVEFAFSVRAQAWEIVNESVRDLLNPTNPGDLSVRESAMHGHYVPDVTWRNAEEPTALLELWHMSRASRNTETGEFGPMAPRSMQWFVVELTQTITISNASATGDAPSVERTVLRSRMTFAKLPALNPLAMDLGTLRLKEGPTLNRSLTSISRLAQRLAAYYSNLENGDLPQPVSFNESIATKLLSHLLGGNCFTSVILTLMPSLTPEVAMPTLRLAAQLGSVVNHAIVNDSSAVGLVQQLRAQAFDLRDKLAAAQAHGGAGASAVDAGSYVLKIHELEGQIVQDNLEKVKLKDEKEKLYERFVALRGKYNQLVTSKADLQQQLISIEEEKLQMGKTLLELELQAASSTEDVEAAKFKLANDLLAAESKLTESVMREKAAEKAKNEMEQRVRDSGNDLRALQIEFVALKTNLANTCADLDASHAKVEELGLELLSAVNARRLLESEVTSVSAERDRLKALHDKANDAKETAETATKALELDNSVLKQEKEQLRTEVMKSRVAYEQKALEIENKRLALERSLVDATRQRDEEVAQLRREVEQERRRRDTEQQAQRSEAAARDRAVKQAQRRVGELEIRLAEKADKENRLQLANDSLQERVRDLEQSYSRKLEGYARQIGELGTAMLQRASSGSGGEHEWSKKQHQKSAMQEAVDRVLGELTQQQQNKEHEWTSANAKVRTELKDLRARHQALVDAYRVLREQMEDAAPRGSTPRIPHENELKVTAAHTSEEERLSNEVGLLRNKLVRMEAEMRAKQDSNLAETEEHQRAMLQLQTTHAAALAELDALRVWKATIGDNNTGAADAAMERLMQDNARLNQELLEASRRAIEAGAAVAAGTETSGGGPGTSTEDAAAAAGAAAAELAEWKARALAAEAEVALLQQQLADGEAELARLRAAPTKASRTSFADVYERERHRHRDRHGDGRHHHHHDSHNRSRSRHRKASEADADGHRRHSHGHRRSSRHKEHEGERGEREHRRHKSEHRHRDRDRDRDRDHDRHRLHRSSRPPRVA